MAVPIQAQDRSATPTRLAPGEQVRIDGVLDEPIWQRAALLGKLTQTHPVEGAEPTRATEVRLAHDKDFLYLGILCRDDPTQIRARQMDRDARVEFDDVVEIWIDTFDDHRFAYWFQITPAGSKGDALISDAGERFNKSWDGIWYARSRITDEGWVAEVALPFKTVAFRAGGTTWGFNLQRKRVANGERMRWAYPSVAYRFFNITRGGEFTGLEGMEQGYGIDVVPYVKGSVVRDELAADDDAMADGDLGLDVRWRPTPASQVRLTVNTDFAETEVDERLVNLTRFPLFFPEKREFFLEDAGLYEFGSPARRRDLIPFFSRTIGRDADGIAVPIIAGIKLGGRFGDWGVGFLDAYLDEHGTVQKKNVAVARVSRNLGSGGSYVGMIATSGRPLENGDSQTAGVDFRLGSPTLFGEDKAGNMWGYFLNTRSSDDAGDGSAYGLQLQTRTATWENNLSADVIEEGFLPELGFVRRSGIEAYEFETEYTWRGGDKSFLRSYEAGIEPRYVKDRAGNEDTWELPIKWGMFELQSEDSITFETRRIFERLEESFELGDVDVSPGDYDMLRHQVEIETNNRRLWRIELEAEYGDFFSGTLRRYSIAPILIPNKYVLFRLAYEHVDARLAEGDFSAQVFASNVDFSFTPDLSWKNLLQYDTESRNLGAQSRVRWVITPGQDLFVVGLFGWDREDGSFVATTQELTVKLKYTLRF